MTVPDVLPTLSAGSHDAEHGQACVMEYVSLLAGEEWSDRPECTHPLLAHEARTVNDLLPDADRSRLVPLIGRLFGTTDDSPVLRARLRTTQARQVSALLEKSARPQVLAAVERAEGWVGREGTEADVHGAFAEAMAQASAAAATSSDLDGDHAGFHAAMTRLFPFVLSPELEAAEAHALLAVVTAHRVAVTDCRADCGNEGSRARRMVKDLGGLIDTYDEVTGRVAVELTSQQVRELADVVG